MNGESSVEPVTVVAHVCRQGRRACQEDAAAYLVHRDWVFLVVADGLGGLSNGGYAARKTCEVFLQAVARALPRGGDPAKTLQDAAFLVNGLLLAEKRSRQWPDLGTTVALALYRSRKLTVGHAGDSRVYLVAADDVQLLSRDHSPAQELLEQGLASSLSQARRLVGTGVTSCLGDEQFAGLEFREVPLGPHQGFLLVLTTDGAHEFLEPADFLHQATGSPSVAALADRLAVLAWQRGSEDNITVLAAELGAFPRSAVPAAPVSQGEVPRFLKVAPLLKRWVVAFVLGLLMGGLASWVFQKWRLCDRQKPRNPSEMATPPAQSLILPPPISWYENR
ncbi:MAG: PP2C family protein-serine/threonine phosphatase [Thermoanaerobaculum sp.]